MNASAPDALPLLLHICCAPCGGGCLEPLSGRPVTLYYSNSNLADAAEYERRLEPVRRLAELFQLRLELDPYDHGAWLAAVAGLEDEPEGGARCRRCFEYNLARAAQRAGSDGHFCTTLTVSPRKSSRTIFEAGAAWPGRFEPFDFKKGDGYRRGCELARKYGFYRQNFCGCEFSRERLEKSRSAC